MTDPTPVEVLNEYIAAFVARDFDRMRATLSNDTFYYRGPVSTHTDATEFVMDISRVGQILDGIDVRRIFTEGNEVCAILDFRIRINIVDITRVVLWAVVENGRIVSLEAFFDATEYSQMFPEREQD